MTFLEKNKPYLFRTVTMIYTGRLLDFNEQEFLIGEACWIAETKRWMDSVLTGEFNEVEPYGKNTVVIGRGAILDVVEIPKLPTEQK